MIDCSNIQSILFSLLFRLLQYETITLELRTVVFSLFNTIVLLWLRFVSALANASSRLYFIVFDNFCERCALNTRTYRIVPNFVGKESKLSFQYVYNVIFYLSNKTKNNRASNVGNVNENTVRNSSVSKLQPFSVRPFSLNKLNPLSADIII